MRLARAVGPPSILIVAAFCLSWLPLVDARGLRVVRDSATLLGDSVGGADIDASGAEAGVEVIEDGARGITREAAAGLSVQKKTPALLLRQDRVETLQNTERNALEAQQKALEALATEEEKLATEQEAMAAQERVMETEVAALKEERQTWWHWLLFNGLYLFVYVWLVACAGYVYRKHIQETIAPPVVPARDPDGFHYSLLDTRDCRRDAMLCLCSFACPPVRWAATVSNEKVQMMPFWAALFLMAVLIGLHGLTFHFSHLFLVGLGTYSRHRIRQVFNLERAGKTTCLDFLAWWFCLPCAVAQEARQVDYMLRF